MKILFVAMADSIHTARWISQLYNQGWDIHLFPSIDSGVVHPDIKHITIHHSLWRTDIRFKRIMKISLVRPFLTLFKYIGNRIILKIRPNYHQNHLKKIIKKINPDIIHSMETQAAGYLTLEVKRSYNGIFPVWMHTVWGSDIYLFGRLKDHKKKIRDVLKSCDYYLCECERDIKSAKNFGYSGEILWKTSAEGGFDSSFYKKLRQDGPISKRRKIMLKGYQGWAGRALVGLHALELCADLLSEYEILIYVASPEVVIAAELFTDSTRIPTKIIPNGTSHNEIMRYHGESRLSIGINISDGLPSSFLEAMVMGSFPIQSFTSCADEWIIDGKSGFIVPPEDPEIISGKIRVALINDELINNAATLNEETIRNKIDFDEIQKKIIRMYEKISADRVTQIR